MNEFELFLSGSEPEPEPRSEELLPMRAQDMQSLSEYFERDARRYDHGYDRL